MTKKGVELSVNVIIVAAIALAVLVVLFMIFTGRIGLFSRGVQETTSCDQACKAAGYGRPVVLSSTEACTTGGYVPLVGYYSDPASKIPCCCSKTIG